MAELIELEVNTPERQLVRDAVAEIQVPGKDGYLGILPGHAPLVSELGIGSLSYTVGGRRRLLAVHCGFLEVLPDHVHVLADSAERAEEINVDRARKALSRAQEQLSNPQSGVEPAEALAAIARAQARISAAEEK